MLTHPPPAPCSQGGARPLHYAAAANHAEVVSALLAAKADARARDSRGEQPIHWAGAKGAIESVQVLLSTGGVEPDAASVSGWTLMHHAALNGRADLLEDVMRRLKLTRDPLECSRQAAPPPLPYHLNPLPLSPRVHACSALNLSQLEHHPLST